MGMSEWYVVVCTCLQVLVCSHVNGDHICGSVCTCEWLQIGNVCVHDFHECGCAHSSDCMHVYVHICVCVSVHKGGSLESITLTQGTW